MPNFLIDLSDRNNLGGGAVPPQMGFVGYPSVPPLPQMPDPPGYKPFNYPPPPPSGGGGGGAAETTSAGGNSVPKPFNYNILPNSNNEKKDLNINTDFLAAVSFELRFL